MEGRGRSKERVCKMTQLVKAVNKHSVYVHTCGAVAVPI